MDVGRNELKGEYRSAFEYLKEKYQDRDWVVMENHEAQNVDVDALAIHFSTDDENISWCGTSIHNPLTSECGRFEFKPMEGDEPTKHNYYGLTQEDAIFMNHVNENLWALGDIKRWERIRDGVIGNWQDAAIKFGNGVGQWEEIENSSMIVLESIGEEAQIAFDLLFKMCVREWSATFDNFLEMWLGLVNKTIEAKKRDMKPNWKMADDV